MDILFNKLISKFYNFLPVQKPPFSLQHLNLETYPKKLLNISELLPKSKLLSQITYSLTLIPSLIIT